MLGLGPHTRPRPTKVWVPGAWRAKQFGFCTNIISLDAMSLSWGTAATLFKLAYAPHLLAVATLPACDGRHLLTSPALSCNMLLCWPTNGFKSVRTCLGPMLMWVRIWVHTSGLKRKSDKCQTREVAFQMTVSTSLHIGADNIKMLAQHTQCPTCITQAHVGHEHAVSMHKSPEARWLHRAMAGRHRVE